MKQKILLYIFLVLASNFAFAQEKRSIRGRVFDVADKTPLVGATVYIKGTATGTTTNADGEFYLSLVGSQIEKMELAISFIGYKLQTKLIRGQSVFKFNLEEDVNSLEEVVVTSSYGTQKLKQEVVGSITHIKTKDIVPEQAAVSFDELLEGQSSGVLIETSTGVGEPVNIHIRGQGSLTPLTSGSVGSSTQPLIIVDGVILAEEISLDENSFFDASDGNFAEDLMNPFAKIGINDIESINILKDAAAVSLYGADGANGVILITTKKGQKGPMKFNVNIQGGFNSAINRIEYMNGQQYQELRNMYYLNSGQPENVQKWNGVNTNWFNLLNRTGNYQNIDFSFSGGSEKLTYRAAIGYQIINEPQIKNDFKKYNAAFSFQYSTKKLNISLSTKPSYTKKNTPNTLYSFAVQPTLAPYDEEGNYTHFETYGNPLAVAHQNRVLVNTYSLINSIKLNYIFNESLSFSTLYGLDFSNKDQDNYYSGLNETGRDNNGNIGRRMLRDRDTRKWNWDAKLFFNKDFENGHYMDVLAGVETRENFVKFAYSMGKDFPILDEIIPIEKAEIQSYAKDKSKSTGRSFFSQVNYDFKKKYFFLANFRIDQSSAFGGDNNTSYNGGFGASWVISKENFLSNYKWLEFLRARVSYGTSGNSRIGSYRALGLYTVKDKDQTGYNGNNYAYPSSAPNPNLGWEKNYKFDVGLDISTKSGVSLTLEYFNDDIRDMIVSRDVINEIGYESVQINGANMYNRGIEASISTQAIKTKGFKWSLNFNLSRVNNKVTHLQGLGSDYSSAERARAQRVGYSTNVIWGYQYVGVDPATGRELFNVDGNLIDAKYLKDHYNDKINWEPIGNSKPDFHGGVSNKFNIGKNLDVRVVMTYSAGAGKMVQKNLVDHYRLLFNRNLAVDAYYGSWKREGDIAFYPAVNNSNPLVTNSTKYLYSTSYIKLKTIHLSYRLPVKDLHIPFKNLSIYMNGSNLFYWYKDRSNGETNGIAELQNVYPKMRTFSFGIKAGF